MNEMRSIAVGVISDSTRMRLAVARAFCFARLRVSERQRRDLGGSDLDLPRRMRLKPLRRYPLHNGSLDCRLFNFEMVTASYRKPK